MRRFVEYGPLLIVILLAVNVLFLNIFVITRLKPLKEESVTTVATPQASLCDESCQQSIAKEVVGEIPTPQITPAINPSSINTSHEYIIPLGSGTVRSLDYTDVPGAEVYIDTNNYPKITKVVFEVYMTIPTASGLAYAKLYNVTDKHDVWFSEVSMETDQVVRNVADVSLEKGNKLYRVQLKSTMNVDVRLLNARIHIYTN